MRYILIFIGVAIAYVTGLFEGRHVGHATKDKYYKEHPIIKQNYITYTPLSEFHSDGSTIADQGNNPGCLTLGYEKYDTLAIGYIRGTGSYKFLVFPDSATGWYALKLRILQDSTESLYGFMHTYCKDLPKNYMDAIMAALDAKPMDSVSDHLDKINIIARTIATQEGWHRGKRYQRRTISSH